MDGTSGGEGATVNALRLVCEVIGALVLLGWVVVILGLLLATATVHMERARKRRELSLCRSCGEPQQGGYCQNCAPASGEPEGYPTIQAANLRSARAALFRLKGVRCAPSAASPDTLEDLLDPTVEEP